MAEQVRGQGGSAGGGDIGADRRAQAIEARVAKLLEAQTRGRRQVLILAALVVAMFGIFAYATTRQVKENLSGDRLREAVIARAPEVQPKLTQHLDEVARDVMPVYRDLAVQRFREIGPEVSKTAMARLETLPADASKQIEAQLMTSRDRVLLRIEPELSKRYPSLSDEKKKDLLAGYFHTKIDEENKELAAKMNAVRTAEEIRMHAVLEKFAIGAEAPAPSSRPRERERQFLHALVDVLMDTDLSATMVSTPLQSGTTARLASAKTADLGGEQPTTEPSAATTEPATTAPATTAPAAP